MSALFIAASMPSAGKQRVAARTTKPVGVQHTEQQQQQGSDEQPGASSATQSTAAPAPRAALHSELQAAAWARNGLSDEGRGLLLLNQWQHKHEVRSVSCLVCV